MKFIEANVPGLQSDTPNVCNHCDYEFQKEGEYNVQEADSNEWKDTVSQHTYALKE
jgi:hypothetical protein